MFKYRCLLESGRDFVLTTDIKDETERAYEMGFQAYNEAALMDDYLIDVERIDD
jgi:hypothetical protein